MTDRCVKCGWWTEGTANDPETPPRDMQCHGYAAAPPCAADWLSADPEDREATYDEYLTNQGAKPTTQCGAQLSRCVCSLPADDGHTVHTCTDPSEVNDSGRCRGQWRDGGVVVQYPTGARTEAEAVEHVVMVRRGQLIPDRPEDTQ